MEILLKVPEWHMKIKEWHGACQVVPGEMNRQAELLPSFQLGLHNAAHLSRYQRVARGHKWVKIVYISFKDLGTAEGDRGKKVANW